ncbi:MAG: VOC family protein [Alphaproteobacteria bacterium]|nr:VOC family protein [Alphaproteobacteria bacterium]MDE2012661.1 VOC family protein [Alphaproteobacteria bacterium]MDE2072142.1 VOC family protein [Alphaproteobacteria bacterium]
MDIKIRRIAHIVLFVRDPEVSAAWYAKVLGMQESARAGGGPYAGGIFMTFGESDHDIALFPRPESATTGKEFEHVGLELDCGGDITQLRRAYGNLLKNNVRIAEILDHGISTGIYFYDPDGHMLEIFAQRMPAGAATREKFKNDEGMAEPTQLEPLFD